MCFCSNSIKNFKLFMKFVLKYFKKRSIIIKKEYSENFKKLELIFESCIRYLIFIYLILFNKEEEV
ncbi:hypothetical protein C3495_10150 [Clostridiaceae bacterium 14S0207]|nr:hypothetical protein C3495_10150 [Clostridiaceae bacterium 14S0207]